MPAANKHPLAVEPQTVATYKTSYCVKDEVLKDNEPFCCQQTAHFFLSYRYSTRDTMLAMEPKAPRTAKIVEVICIASFGKSPRKATYMPPFRLHGTAGNRLLPYTVCKRDADGEITRSLLHRKRGECQIKFPPVLFFMQPAAPQ